MVLLAMAACGGDPAHRPDEVLRKELGLTDRDVVHRFSLTSDSVERSDPVEDTVPRGAWVEFVSGDHRVHTVAFPMDSLFREGRRFLERTSQLASPPLVDLDSRFVVSFREAPPGRYPFLLEGNARAGRGVVIVTPGR